jgi:hypothetical protein
MLGNIFKAIFRLVHFKIFGAPYFLSMLGFTLRISLTGEWRLESFIPLKNSTLPVISKSASPEQVW